MRKTKLVTVVVALLTLVLVPALVGSQTGRTLNFQGYISDMTYGTVQDGTYSMRFTIYDAISGGNRLWPPSVSWEEHVFVFVVGGKFNVELGSQGQPLTDTVFAGGDQYLQTWVCQPAGLNCMGFEPLPIRLPLLIPAQMGLETPTPGDEDTREDEWEAVEAVTGGISEAWLLQGNAGTSPSTDFLGTTDDAALSIRVGGRTALRIEPHDISPNLIGGYQLNSVAGDVYGATIGGGGMSARINEVGGIFGSIGGGEGNRVLGEYGSIAGGFVNSASTYSSIGGGYANHGLDSYTTIGGGYGNTATDRYATIAGGSSNAASGLLAFVGSGQNNTASGEASVVVGGQFNTAKGSHAAVAGGSNNAADGTYGFVAGGLGNNAFGYCSLAAGSNTWAQGRYSVVAGGEGGGAEGSYSFVAGGNYNTASGDFSFAAGSMAKAEHTGSFVWADATGGEFKSTEPNQFSVRASNGARFETSADSGLVVTGPIESTREGIVFPDGSEQTTAAAPLPRGVIVIWSGRVSEIPEGWALCDGTNGTPNLVDSFVQGAGSDDEVMRKGGSTTHQHKSEPHNHLRPEWQNPSEALKRLYPRNPYETTGITLWEYADTEQCSRKVKTYSKVVAAAVSSELCLTHTHAVLPPDEMVSVTISAAEHLPPFYKLAFIMKL